MKNNLIRVGYLVSTLQRCGPINVLLGIIKHLDRNVFSPLIICLSDDHGDNNLVQTFEDLNVEVLYSGLSRFSSYFGKKKINRLIVEYNIDIVHNHGFRADLMMSNSTLDIPIVTTVHNYPLDDYRHLYGGLFGYIMGTVHTRIIKSYTYSVAVSSHLCDFFTCHTFIDNGVDVQFRNKTTVRLLPPKTTWLFVGELIKRKNLGILIEAFKKLDIDKHELFIVGDGVEKNVLIKKSEGCSNITFVGRVDDVENYYSKADYFVFPSLSESFGLVTVEAMSYGIPVLLSDIEANRYFYMKNESIGGLFEANSIDSLVEGMIRISKLDYQKMQKACLELASQFSSRKMSLSYQNYYLKALNV